MQQIRFYWEAGFFEDTQTVLEILDDCDGILKMAARQAEEGKKYNPVSDQVMPTPYDLYASDLMIGNNTVFLRSDSHQASYISYNTFNFARSNNRFFNETTESWLNIIMSKSTLLSKVAEKQRNRFFKAIHLTIQNFRDEIING